MKKYMQYNKELNSLFDKEIDKMKTSLLKEKKRLQTHKPVNQTINLETKLSNDERPTKTFRSRINEFIISTYNRLKGMF